MADPILEVKDLRRRFEQVEAVAGLSFSVERGSVVGFIGANGAGKTTTMRILVTLDLPTAGEVRVDGIDAIEFPDKVRQKVGWMPDAYGTYDHMTVWDYLDFYGRAYGFAKGERESRVKEVMAFADLEPIADWPMNRLSKGMAQRLCFGRTLIHDPELLILDEPAAGLDPKARIEFKNLVRILAQRGKTIFISSHILSELGEMCDSLMFIDNGQLVHHGSSASLTAGSSHESIVDVVVAGNAEPLLLWVEMNPGWRVMERLKKGARLAFAGADDEALAAALRRMIQDGISVAEFHKRERRLEDAFVEIIKERRSP